jgi:hypothetical protein
VPMNILRSAEEADPVAAESSSPTIPAAAMHDVSDAEATAFVDTLLGGADEWKSPRIRYRLSSDFQADWKAEIGHWLKTAERHSFLPALLDRLLKRAKRGTRSVGVDPNDKRHNELVAELAPAMVTHYFVHTGWTFGRWEPVTGGAVDVDVELEAPDRCRVHLQGKAPDQPGSVVDHRRVDGEYNSRVLAAVAHAANQLPRVGGEAKFVAVCANRTWPLSSNPQCLVTDLVGSTVGINSEVTLPRSHLGRFWTVDWQHVSGVVALDYLRGVDVFTYPCTVLLNPKANVQASPDWFPRARVCQLVEGRFRWIRGEPGRAHTLPDGTAITP